MFSKFLWESVLMSMRKPYCWQILGTCLALKAIICTLHQILLELENYPSRMTRSACGCHRYGGLCRDGGAASFSNVAVLISKHWQASIQPCLWLLSSSSFYSSVLLGAFALDLIL
jgi:hypothetical protein